MKNSHGEARRWLVQAESDFHFATLGLERGFYAQCCFLCQQATEKAMKALHYHGGARLAIGHSVARLCAAAARYRPEFADKARRWNLLDGYYIPTRYPNGLPDSIPAEVYTRDAAESAVILAQEAVAWVGDLLDQTRTG